MRSRSVIPQSGDHHCGCGESWTNNSSNTFTVVGLPNLNNIAVSIVAGNGSIVISNSGTVGGFTQTLTLGGTATGSSFASVLSGGGNLTKSGAGTWTLSGANTYSNGTTISAGTLRIANATALGNGSGAVGVSSGAVLDLNGQTVANTNALTLNGTGISSGGALINSSATAASYAGTVALGSNSSIGGTGNISLGGVVSGGFTLTNVGGDALTLSGANTYTGATTVENGTLVAGANARREATVPSAILARQLPWAMRPASAIT